MLVFESLADMLLNVFMTLGRLTCKVKCDVIKIKFCAKFSCVKFKSFFRGGIDELKFIFGEFK